MSDVIEIAGLSYRFGRRQVLRDLDLAVPEGSVTALLGRNGAGKTTLFRALTGELPLPRGAARVLGLDPACERHALLRSVGYVPDRTDLPRWMCVRQHWALLEPFHPTWDGGEARRLAALLGVDPDARYSQLSKGGQALACLVAALAHRPRLLLLDEPFSGLDVIARRRVFDGILDLLRGEGRSALVVSHSLVDVQRCADRIALLADGRVRLCGDMEELSRGAARLAVELAPEVQGWQPPAGARVERRDGSELVLFALEDGAALENALAGDPAVRRVEPLARDLEDVVAAALSTEVAA